MMISVPENARVFVLDDTQERLFWFRQHLKGVAKYRDASTADRALEILSAETFDVIFLDHDLCWEDAGYPDRQHGNGKEIARYLARTKFSGHVIIHSKNEDGVSAMLKWLPNAEVARYGDFEIVIARQSAAR